MAQECEIDKIEYGMDQKGTQEGDDVIKHSKSVQKSVLRLTNVL